MRKILILLAFMVLLAFPAFAGDLSFDGGVEVRKADPSKATVDATLTYAPGDKGSAALYGKIDTEKVWETELTLSYLPVSIVGHYNSAEEWGIDPTVTLRSLSFTADTQFDPDGFVSADVSGTYIYNMFTFTAGYLAQDAPEIYAEMRVAF